MTSPVTIDDILLAVQRITHIGVRDIKGRGRTANVREARLLAYFVSSQCFSYSFAAIARRIGRDHTTVSAMVKKLVASRRFDPSLIDRVEDAATVIAAARREGRANYAGSPIYAEGGRT